MLLWDPKARGGGLNEQNRQICFQMLENFLSIKVGLCLFNIINNKERNRKKNNLVAVKIFLQPGLSHDHVSIACICIYEWDTGWN